jgi:hypothetical protein
VATLTAFQTEVPFTLPKGYVDEDGALHRCGVMRLATAADEIVPLKDARVKQNPAYLTVIVLARVITQLEGVPDINAGVIEELFASDLAYLQELYETLNGDGLPTVSARCPRCEHRFEVTMALDEVGV